MLKISRLADYAALLMSYFAKQPIARYSAAAIAEQVMIAQPTVSKILKKLHEAGLLISTRGVNGGYQLAFPPEQISVAAIITAIDGELAITECTQAQTLCRCELGCHMRSNWQMINRKICNLLEGFSLRDMCHPNSQALSMQFDQEQRVKKSESPS